MHDGGGRISSLALFIILDRKVSHRQIKFTLEENQMAGAKGKSGGTREGAGRPKKPPVLIVVADTDDPIEFMLSVMRDTTADARLRLDAARALLPFLHPKKEAGGKKGAAQTAAAKVITGKFAPGKPPTLATITKLTSI
jgi:hypothetical protein